MKPDLSYEQCRDLEKWGLDQTLEKGDWILIEDEGKWVGYLISIEDKDLVGSVLTRSAGKYIKLPSAEEMIEFLKTKAGFYSLKISFYLGATKTELQIRLKPGLFRIFTRTDPSIDQSLYALCEKVFGGKEGE